MPRNDPLAIYLHDHLAGSKVAIDLLGAVRDQHAREPLGQFAAELLVEIEEDRAVLRQLGERVGAGRSSRVKEGRMFQRCWSAILLGKVFHMCWPLSETSSKRITIDEKPNHQVMHLFRLGKANRAAY